MRVLVTPTSFTAEKKSRATDLLRSFCRDIVYNPFGRPLYPHEIIPLLEGVDGYIAGLDYINEEVIQMAPSSLKVISRYGAGYDRIDVAAADKKGIIVTNTPGVNSESVADLTFGLILSVARKISLLDKRIKAGEWPRTIGIEIYGKTMGILGLGAIGKGVARRARGFSMNVLAYDPFLDHEFASQNGIKSCTMDEVLENADILSLHLPLTENTYNIINSQSIKRMKQGAIIVNTARGGLIDEAAAYEALKNGWLGGLGVDVFEKEPPGESPLFELDNVVATPHAGAHTAEAVEKMAMLAVQNLIDVLSGRECKYIIKQTQL